MGCSRELASALGVFVCSGGRFTIIYDEQSFLLELQAKIFPF